MPSASCLRTASADLLRSPPVLPDHQDPLDPLDSLDNPATKEDPDSLDSPDLQAHRAQPNIQAANSALLAHLASPDRKVLLDLQEEMDSPEHLHMAVDKDLLARLDRLDLLDSLDNLEGLDSLGIPANLALPEEPFPDRRDRPDLPASLDILDLLMASLESLETKDLLDRPDLLDTLASPVPLDSLVSLVALERLAATRSTVLARHAAEVELPTLLRLLLPLQLLPHLLEGTAMRPLLLPLALPLRLLSLPLRLLVLPQFQPRVQRLPVERQLAEQRLHPLEARLQEAPGATVVPKEHAAR